jgi:DNA modification methylase
MMRVEQIGSATLYLGTMEDTIGGIEHVDHILTDPPYLYIKNHDREKTIICEFQNNCIRKHHPTEKPIRLAERILALISNPGDVIYDPFMGSGSFGVACINTGRKYIGSEMKSEYFDIACKRIKEAINHYEKT